MSKSSTFLISDLISEQQTNLLNTTNSIKQKNHYQHNFFITNSNSINELNTKMNTNYHINKKSDELSNSRTSFSSHGGDTPSVSSTSSISSISTSNIRQEENNHINQYMIKNKPFSDFLCSTNGYNANLETNIIHSANKYCNCMACNAVRFFSLVNPNFNENFINTNQQQDGVRKNMNDKINNINFKNIDLKQNKTNYLRGNFI